jgi:hypothetical protein
MHPATGLKLEGGIRSIDITRASGYIHEPWGNREGPTLGTNKGVRSRDGNLRPAISETRREQGSGIGSSTRGGGAGAERARRQRDPSSLVAAPQTGPPTGSIIDSTGQLRHEKSLERLLRNGQDWADIIDFLTMRPGLGGLTREVPRVTREARSRSATEATHGRLVVDHRRSCGRGHRCLDRRGIAREPLALLASSGRSN